MQKGFFQGALAEQEVQSTVDRYALQFEANGETRQEDAHGLARDYYELVTQFYEYGWGESFHFAPRTRGESVRESLRRYERHLGERLQLRRGMRALDVGCGIGGPLRHLASEFGAHLTGITIAPYQVQRGLELNRRAGLQDCCSLVLGDFQEMPFEPRSFDAAYTIEACCHAADRRKPFSEVLRVLKPGGHFSGYDWCMTDAYHPGNLEHERIKGEIEKGNGVARLVSSRELVAALQDVGFEVQYVQDWATSGDSDLPWYQPLASGLSLRGFRNSRAGAFVTHQIVRALETLHLSPRGTVQVHDVLRTAQRSLVEGGRLGIFTPSYFWVARKPG
jgi:sterol 24-C-methyltransferase